MHMNNKILRLRCLQWHCVRSSRRIYSPIKWFTGAEMAANFFLQLKYVLRVRVCVAFATSMCFRSVCLTCQLVASVEYTYIDETR